jgi:hypothetical protein
MKANPGGQLLVSEILGRERLIEDLWEALDRQSILITAERRIGKTSVIRKMCAEPPADWVPVLQDLERVPTANEFAEAIYEQVSKFLSRWQKTAQRARAVWESIGGAEIGGILKIPESKEKHWKHLLTGTVEDLVTQQSPKRLVFFWDEMPYMLDSIRRRDGEDTAMELLDVLRALRQSQPGFRMVLTGSIGLHHVLTSLKETDYRNQPVNDMYPVEVTPLARVDAVELARLLIDGEQIATSDSNLAAASIARLVDDFPYYIHCVVRRLKITGRRADPGSIEETVAEQLVDSQDPWDLAHFRQRIKLYYPEKEHEVTGVLDALSLRSDPVPVDAILNEVQTIGVDDQNQLLDLLKLLQRDHYLTRTTQGHFSFRFPLIQRWWRLDRGL